MDNILRERLGGMLPIEKIFHIRQLHFLRRVAQMESSRLTFQMLSSQATECDGKIKGGIKINTLTTWKATLEKAGILEDKNGGRLDEWIPKIHRGDCVGTIEESLELPKNSFIIKKKRRRHVFPSC